MPIYKDVENFSKLFDAKYIETRELIRQGETHLDNLAEGFLEADRVIRNLPTADVTPRSEVAKIFEEIDSFIYKVLNDEHYIMGDMCFDVAELKKKYTEGGE